ncbi:Hsp20/alpha crystallin family protein [Serratia marcescens]|uniref:Hsp20/alpha crystallin family protein n=1 Tax=Serratia marcescens TaxID=615 RepID=A0A939NRS4_SERMA|nr:Hsp20/alpha crystallin family protein [Serratia marcescens]
MQNGTATMFGRIPQRQGARTGNEAMTTADWAPMVDISEDENAFLLKLDLPEVLRMPRASARKRRAHHQRRAQTGKEKQCKKFHRIERAYGRFVRSSVLPDNVDPTKVTADERRRVGVRLVKAEQAKPKQIEISVNQL